MNAYYFDSDFISVASGYLFLEYQKFSMKKGDNSINMLQRVVSALGYKL